MIKIIERLGTIVILKVNIKCANDKNYRKVKDHRHFKGNYGGAAQMICNLRFNVPIEISVVFHNGSNYDYHFIIKQLANKCEGQF